MGTCLDRLLEDAAHPATDVTTTPEEIFLKLLHTSDWHLGRTAGPLSREADFRVVLEEIVAVAREHKPDFVLHTGDLFDVSRPAVTDMMLGFQALQALAWQSRFAGAVPVV